MTVTVNVLARFPNPARLGFFNLREKPAREAAIRRVMVGWLALFRKRARAKLANELDFERMGFRQWDFLIKVRIVQRRSNLY